MRECSKNLPKYRCRTTKELSQNACGAPIPPRSTSCEALHFRVAAFTVSPYCGDTAASHALRHENSLTLARPLDPEIAPKVGSIFYSANPKDPGHDMVIFSALRFHFLV